MATTGNAATTLFQGAPTDKLPVADVYSAPGIDLLSSSVTGVKKVLGNAFTSIRSQGFNLSDLARMVKVDGGHVSISTDEATKRLNSLLGVNISSIKDMPLEAQNRAAAKLATLAGINTNELTTTSGQVIKVVNGVNAQDVNGILNGLKKVLGSDIVTSVVDTTAQISFLGSMLEYSTEWGLTDTIDIIMSKYEQGTESRDYLEYTLNNSYTAAVASGNLPTVATIIKNTGKDKLLAMYPNAVDMLLGGFVFPADATKADYPTLLALMESILVSLNPTWDSVVRNGVAVTTTAPFYSASNDSKELLSWDDKYWDLVLMAPSYPREGLTTIAKRMYPDIAL